MKNEDNAFHFQQIGFNFNTQLILYNKYKAT